MPRKCLSCFTPFGRLNREFWLHLITLRFDSVFTEYAPQVFFFKCAECRSSALTCKPASWYRLRTSSSLSRWSSRLFFEMQRRSSVWARASLRIPLAPSWKKYGEPALPIGDCEYWPNGKLMVQILDASGSNLMVLQPVLRSTAVAKVKSSGFAVPCLFWGLKRVL
jgi:hypothetical protein